MNAIRHKPLSRALILWSHVTDSCDRLGGAFPKLAQFLSARRELVGDEAVAVLQRLQDSATPLNPKEIQQVLNNALKTELENGNLLVDPIPIASATIAQVHLATAQCHSGQTMVLKIKRPHIERQLRTDVAIIQMAVAVVSVLPWLKWIPLRESLENWGTMVLRQTDFNFEAACIRRYRQLFAHTRGIRVPALVDEFCSANVIAMEYLEGFVKLSNTSTESSYCAVVQGLRALYMMIFEAGFFHCDLHPGNLLCNSAGEIGIVDMGMTAEFEPGQKTLFAEFFASIALQNGPRATRIILESATKTGECNPTALTTDVQDLLQRVSGTNVANFNISKFVVELFRIQQRHQIFGSPAFSLAIIALVNYEGMLKRFAPDLAFQRVAMPFVIDALRVKLILPLIQPKSAQPFARTSRGLPRPNQLEAIANT